MTCGLLIFHNSVVHFLYLMVGKHTVETLEGFGGTREHDDTTDGTVETVYDTEEHSTGFGIAFLDVSLDEVREGDITCLVALNDFAGGFVDDDDVIVFVEDFHCN